MGSTSGLVEGQAEDCDDWTVGHPVLFPYTLVTGHAMGSSYQIRVPVDDTNTMHIFYSVRVRGAGEEPKEIAVSRGAVDYDQFGLATGPSSVAHDELAWIGQGPITDRTVEHLATSDRGIMMYRNMLLENIEKVERGEDPIGVVRDMARNYPHIEIRHEAVPRAPYALVGTGAGR